MQPPAEIPNLTEREDWAATGAYAPSVRADRRPGDRALGVAGQAAGRQPASQHLDWRDQRDIPAICRECERWQQANPLAKPLTKSLDHAP